MTNEQAYKLGYAAGKRSQTGNMERAGDTFFRKHGYIGGFCLGFIDGYERNEFGYALAAA